MASPHRSGITFFGPSINNFFSSFLGIGLLLVSACSPNEKHWTQAVRAINQNDVPGFEKQLTLTLIKKKGPYGQDLLYLASEKGRLEMCDLLLTQGADPNSQSAAGTTPLMSAAAQGKALVITLLLDHGAKLDLLDNAGNTALHVASVNGKVEVVKILLDHGATKSITNADGKTAYQLAKRFSHQKILHLLQ